MKTSFLIVLAVFFPVICGCLILLKKEFAKRDDLMKVSCLSLLIGAVFVLPLILGPECEFTLLHIVSGIDLYFHIDSMGKLFAAVMTVVWIASGFFATEYMKHENEEKRYFGIYVLVYGILMGLCFAGNIVTYYLFFEMMSLLTMPMVMHTKTP